MKDLWANRLLSGAVIGVFVALAWVAVYALVSDDDPEPPPVTTVDLRPELARLRSEVTRLDAELDKSNRDQLDLRRTVTTIERASRSSRTPRVAATATVRASGACGEWRPLIARYFPAAEVDRACRVMMCESGGNPNARNPRSSATGLFQILRGLTDPEANVRQAAAMHAKSGWRPWVCK